MIAGKDVITDELIKSNPEFGYSPKELFIFYFFFCEFEMCQSFCLVIIENTMTEFEENLIFNIDNSNFVSSNNIIIIISLLYCL